MKKNLFLLLMMLFCIEFAIAEPVEVVRARQVAVNFLKSTEGSAQQITGQDLVDITATTPFHEFYVFSIRDKGFILVSGDDRSLPILGYSLNSVFVCKDIPDHVRWWLDNYEKQIVQLRENAIVATPEIHSQWLTFIEGKQLVESSSSSVSPLLTTTWNQSPFYNTQCPTDASATSCAGNNHVVAGCVAIATAQVMKYWNWPTTGRSSHSYTHSSYGTLSANFATSYSWSNMPNSLSSSSSSTQVSAVAKLVYHVGVAVEMNYGACGSGAYSIGYRTPTLPSAENALITYFKYANTLVGIEEKDYTLSVWKNIIYNELVNSRPVLYGGSGSSGGHAFVCDGYQSSTDKFHFNFGWGSYCDGYYTIGSLNTNNGSFNSDCDAIIGIKPNRSTSSSSTIIADVNNSSYGSVTGGGTYTPYTQIDTLYAFANSGYKFTKWSDGCIYNPRTIIAQGGTSTFTAILEPLQGDTIAYGTVGRGISYGFGNASTQVYWGIRIPPSSLSAGHNLEKVQFYTDYTGTYQVKIYSGASQPTTLLLSQNVTSVTAGAWNTITLSSPVTISGNETLWITLNSSGVTYPAAIGYSCGNSDGLYWGGSSGSNWYSFFSSSAFYSWMIRGIFKQNITSYTVAVSADPTAGGTVSGGGTYTSGSRCTVTATPAPGYQFVNWKRGNTVVSTNATYTFTVTANRTLKAFFEPSPSCGISISDLPYTDNFDSYTTSTTAKTGVSVPCWTLAHQDVTMTDQDKPMVYYKASYAHSGSYTLFLNYRGIYAMPEFDGDVSSLQLSFFLRQPHAKYLLQVGVMNSLTDISSFTPVAIIDNSSTGVEQVSVDFSSYSGTGHFIAFRNILASGYSGNYSYNYIDDINLEVRPSGCPAISAADLPFSENFDSYTSSTTAKTGVAPDCWTLAHQYVTMSDPDKPMVYYNASYAHSGSYTLLLNYRGIYAMPEFDGDVSSLQLSFFLRQPHAKYQLQVGVMNSLTDVASFTPVATINNSSTGVEQVSVDFSSYSGSGHFIAFRNILASGYSGNYSYNYIDDINLEVRPSGCPAISAADLPFSENFDSYTSSTTAKTGVAPDCWTLAHQYVTMSDPDKPMVYYNASYAHSGSYTLLLNYRGIYAMPEFDGDVSSLQLSFFLRQPHAKYQLQVGVMNSLTDVASFTPVATINNSSTGVEQVSVDFSSYSGSGHFIAFRNILASGYSGNYSYNYIDDINLEVRPSGCPAISAADLPFSENFDSYTSSTTAKTGVAPDCWTLAHQYVTMSDPDKPMVYYNASYAHSGSYTLLLNYRGIYAMPEFDGDVSSLQLSFFLRQPHAKYQLQVGVMNSLTDVASFTPVATINNSSTGVEQVSVDFSSYSGNGHFIAFRNMLASGYSGNYSYNYIDDIRLETRCAIYPDELPYTENFDSYTTSTTAKTGVAPDCWTLAHQYVTMSDPDKPMVYYNASFAHSGSYSLLLNYRGIYAMPEFNGDVSTLQLSFFLRQPHAKYQLQVGVMNSLTDVASFTPVATINNSSTGVVPVSVDFSSYTGNGHYIAFRNILASGYSGNYSYNYIDDITLSLAASKGLDGNGNDVSDNEPLSQKWMTVFPNPTSGMITVEADGEIERIDIFDYTGRCVATVEHQSSVDLSGFASGFYTLRCTLPDRIEVRRVVKQ